MSENMPQRPPPGAVVKSWLKSNRRSQKWLAHELEFSEKHVSNLMRGTAVWRPETARKIEAATGISAIYLMNLYMYNSDGEEPPT